MHARAYGARRDAQRAAGERRRAPARDCSLRSLSRPTFRARAEPAALARRNARAVQRRAECKPRAGEALLAARDRPPEGHAALDPRARRLEVERVRRRARERVHARRLKAARPWLSFATTPSSGAPSTPWAGRRASSR